MRFVLLLCSPFLWCCCYYCRINCTTTFIASTTESVSESGIKLREAVQDSEVQVWDDEVDNDDDEEDDDLFTIRNNQPTSVLRYIVKTDKSNETTGSYGDDCDETFFIRSISQ